MGERLLPWPRVKHQKVITLKCLEGFVHALSDLAACVLPSLRRELDPDPRLLLLMDHVLKLRGDKAVNSCLSGTSATPDVAFPEHKNLSGPPDPPNASYAPAYDLTLGSTSGLIGTQPKAKGVPVDAYTFKLLGTSVGDAKAAGKVHIVDNRPPANEIPRSPAPGQTASGRPIVPVKENEVQKRAASYAAELLSAFEGIKDMLLSLKSTLEYIDPALDRDEAFVAQLQRFERAFRKAKRLFLEPTNLA